MPLRGAYQKTSVEARDRVLAAAASGRNWKAIAEAHEIPYKTAYCWLQNEGQPLKKRGGDTRSKLSEQQVGTIISWLEENVQITLKTICERVNLEMGIEVTQQTISNRLDGRLITLKKVHHLSIGVNSDANKQLRCTYVESILALTAANKNIIFIDETNFNLFCRRSVGRSLRGSRSVITLPNSKGPNLHIIGGITSQGLVYWERRRGSFKTEDFNEWLRRCIQAAINQGMPINDIVAVVDNAPCHSHAEHVFQDNNFHGGTVLRLAPYSPMLNAIEHIWSEVKTHIKNTLQEKFQELMAGDPALTQTEFRLRFLERCADLAMGTIIPLDCQRSCNHVQEHYAPALHLANMPAGN